MDKLINTHVDSVEELEEKIDVVIQRETAKIDIDEILASPEEAISMVVGKIQRIFLDEFADKAVELGFDFGRKVKERIRQDKTIKIDDSKNPKLNDTSEDNKQD